MPDWIYPTGSARTVLVVIYLIYYRAPFKLDSGVFVVIESNITRSGPSYRIVPDWARQTLSIKHCLTGLDFSQNHSAHPNDQARWLNIAVILVTVNNWLLRRFFRGCSSDRDSSFVIKQRGYCARIPSNSWITLNFIIHHLKCDMKGLVSETGTVLYIQTKSYTGYTWSAIYSNKRRFGMFRSGYT